MAKTNTIKKLEKLQKQRAKISQEISDIEAEQVEKVQIPKLKLMVGKCYVYRNNSYGSGYDKWDTFRKILELHETKKGSKHFIFEEFQVDCHGKTSLEIDSHYPYLNKEWWNVSVPFSGWVECPNEEYESERLKAISEMATREKMKKAFDHD